MPNLIGSLNVDGTLRGVISNGTSVITGKLSNAALRGVAVELRIEGTILQWKYEDQDEWQDLIDLSTLDYETLQNLPTIDGVEINGEVAEMIISAIQDLLDEKVDKVQGKELSTNDFTNELKSKLDDIENNAQENVIENIKLNGVTQTIEDKTVDLTVNTFDLSDRIAKGSSIKSVIIGDITNNIASGSYSYAEGRATKAAGQYSHAENNATAIGESSHAEGYGNASGTISHAENSGRAQGSNSHAENAGFAIGDFSHAEGNGGKSQGASSHAEGYSTHADGNFSHTEGYNTQTTSDASSGHAEGYNTKSMQSAAHAEGNATEASGFFSHSEGSWTNATHRSQHVFGEYNLLDESTQQPNQRGTYVEIVGNGTSINDRSNIRTLDWNGNQVLAGKLTVGAIPTSNMDVTTKGYVDNSISGVSDAIPTNVSELNNDSGYLTAETDPTVPQWAKQPQKPAYTATEVGALPSTTYIPTKISDLTNDENYQTDSDVATALSSYATTTYVDESIADAIGDITGISYYVCQEGEYDTTDYTPTIQGQAGVIYLVPKSSTQIGSAIIGSSTVVGKDEDNIFYEYIFNGSSFEKIGDTSVDLSDYLDITDISTNNEINAMLVEIGIA